MSFDGAGKPYRSGPSWKGAVVVMIGAIVAIVVVWIVIIPLLFGR